MATPRRDHRAPTSVARAYRSSDAAALRRQRQSDAVVLAHIVGRALRLRQANANANIGAAPLTLIELIQASAAVFEKHSVAPPEDATFHRHLLALSMDPEPDWEKKIKRFAVRIVPPPTFSSRVGSEGVLSPRSATSARRRTKTLASDVGVEAPPTRRRSRVGAGETRWVPPGSADTRQSARVPVDRFGDVVAAATVPMSLKENQRRNATPTADVATETKTNAEIQHETPTTPAQKLRNLKSIRAQLNEITEELADGGDISDAIDEDVEEKEEGGGEEGEGEGEEEGEGEGEGEDEEDVQARVYRRQRELGIFEADEQSDTISESVASIAPHTFYPSPDRPRTPTVPHPPPVRRVTVDAFHLLATTFQQWRELSRFRRLVHDSRQREMRLTQAVLPPIATFAIFRWILLTLPERHDANVGVGRSLPTNIWTRGVAVPHPPLLRHFTGRLLVWTVHRIVQSWSRFARAARTLRIRAMLRQRTQLLETASECLYDWRKLTKRRRRVKDHGVWVETLHTRRLQRQSLHRWIVVLQHRQREQHVRNLYERRMAGKVFGFWRKRTYCLRLAQALGSRRRLRCVLLAWKRAVQVSDLTQRQLYDANTHFASRILRTCWNDWRVRAKQFQSERIKSARARTFCENTTTRRVWDAWTLSCRTKKAQLQKCGRFVKRRETRRLRRLLTRLACYVYRKRTCALLVMDASVRREWRLLSTVWTKWREHLDATIQQDQRRIKTWEQCRRAQVWNKWKRRTNILKLSSTLRAFFNDAVLRESWQRWTIWVAKQRLYRNLVREWRGERDQFLQLSVFRAFRENVAASRVKHQAAHKFLTRCDGLKLQYYLWTWNKLARERKTSHQRDAHLQAVWREQSVRHCWSKWRGAFHVLRCVQIADRAMARGLCRRVFSCWIRVSTKHRKIQRVARTFHKFQQQRAVNMWRKRLAKRRSQRELAAAVELQANKAALQQTWRVWQELFCESTRRHARVAHAVRQWQNRRLELFFLEWKTRHKRHRHLRALLAHWIQTANGKNVLTCWNAWCTFISIQHDQQLALKDAEQFYHRRAMRKTVQCWRSRCHRAQNNLQVLQRCLAQWTTNQQRRAFFEWVEFARLRRLIRSLSHQSVQNSLKRCLIQWRGWKQRRGHAANALVETTQELQRWRQRQVIQRLRDCASRAKRLASLLGLVQLADSRGIQTASFRRWRQYVGTSRQCRYEVEEASASLLKIRLRKSVLRWVRVVRVKKLLQTTLLQALARSSLGLMGRVFSRWRRYASQRRLFHGLEQKALVFQVFCVLPTAFQSWRTFVQHQTHKRALLARARRLLCHQREAKVFRAWVESVTKIQRARRALRRWRTQCLQHRFSRWRTFCVTKQHKHRAMVHRQTRLQRHIVHAWREQAQRQRLLAQFTGIWRALTAQRCFGTWVRHARIQRSARAVLRRLRDASLGRVVNSWKAAVASQVETSSRIRHKVAIRWNENWKTTSFQRWYAHARRQRLIKSKMLERLQQSTRTGFVRWRAAVVRRRQLDKLSRQVEQIGSKRALLDSWFQWTREQHKRQAVKALRRRILRCSSQAVARLVLCQWRRVAHTGKVASTAQNRHVQQKLRVLFHAWNDIFTSKRRQLKHIALAVRARHNSRLAKGVLRRMRAHWMLKRVCTTILLPQLQCYAVATAWSAWRRHHAFKQQTKQRVAALLLCINKQGGQKTVPLACLTRWRSLLSAHALEHWLRVAQSRRWLRRHTCQAIHAWQTRLSRQTMARWKRWIQRNRHQRKIRASGATHRQARAWIKWLSHHRSFQHAAASMRKADQWRRTHQTSAMIHTWRAVLSTRRRHSLVEAALTLQRSLRLVHRWRQYAVATRARRIERTVALVAVHHRRLRGAWQQWTFYVQLLRRHRQQLQQQTERLQVLIVCSVFRAWRAWSQRQRTVRRVLVLVSQRDETTTARRVLLAWTRYARSRHQRRATAEQCAYASAIKRAVLALRSNVLENQRQRERTRKARAWIDVLRGRHVSRCFHLWSQMARIRRQSRAAVRWYQLGKLLPRVVHAWRRFVSERHCQSARLERAVSCWTGVSARRAWNAWLQCHIQRLHRRQAHAFASRHYDTRTLRISLVAWRAAVVKSKLLGAACRRLLVRWKMQTAYRCFVQWQSHALHQRAQRVSRAIVSSRQASGSLRQAWSQWRRQFVVVRVGQRKRLTRVWLAWAMWTSHKLRWRQFQSQQTRVLLSIVRARHGIQQWTRFVVHAKLSKTLAVLSHRFSRGTLVRRCFEHWIWYLVVRHREKTTMMRVLSWLRNRQLLVVFQGLHSYAAQQRQRKRNMQIAQAHTQRTCIRIHWQAWCSTVRVTRQQREKLRTYVTVMRHLSQSRSLQAWREFAASRRQLRATYVTLLSRRSLVTTRAALDAWKAHVVSVKRVSAAQAVYRTRIYRHSLLSWRRFVVLSRMERMLGASEQRLVERAFVNWRKRAILLQNVQRLAAARQSRFRSQTLTSHFYAWHTWSRLQTKCSSLLANVAIGNSQRLRFLKWKQFTAQRKRLHQLVQGSTISALSAEGTTVVLADSDASSAAKLQRMARFFQRFEVQWDDPAAVWQRWRNVFHARLFHRIRLLHRVFCAWQQRTQRRKYLRHLVISRHKARHVTFKSTVLRQWREVVRTVQRIQRERRRERELLVIVNAEMLRQDKKTVLRHWTAWRSRVDDKRFLLMSATRYQRARLLTKCWLLWAHDYVHVSQAQRLQDARRADQLIAWKARRAVGRLVENRSWRQRVDRVVGVVRTRRQRRWRRICLDRWKVEADTKRRARLLLMFKKRQRLQRVIGAWVQHVAARRQQYRDLEVFIDQRTRRARRDRFQRWREFVLRCQHKHDAMSAALAFQLSMRLRLRWLQFVQNRKRTKRWDAQAEQRLAAWHQRRTVQRWHVHARSDRLWRLVKAFILRKQLAVWKCATQLAIAERWAALVLRKHAKRVLEQWAHTAQLRRRRRIVGDELRDLQSMRRRGHVWMAWRIVVQCGRDTRRAHEHALYSLERKFLLRWQHQAKAEAARRLSRTVLAREYASFRTKHRALRWWGVGVRAVHQRRAVLLTCMVKLRRAFQLRVEHVILHEWAEALDRERYTRECAVVLESRRISRSLRRWRQRIADRRRLDQLRLDAATHRRSRLLSVVFFHWQNYALAWKDAERMRARDAARSQKTKTGARRPPPPPPPSVVCVELPLRKPMSEDESDEDEEEVSALRFRRPLSPMRKRLDGKRSNKLLDPMADALTPMPTFCEAATLSLDVKKRLLLLGKWKPTHTSLSQV